MPYVEKLNKNYWVHILHCENTGYTINLTKRYEAHLNGTANYF